MTQQPHQERPFSFRDVTLVACGTLRPELQALTEDGRLDARRILYTAPGLHEWQAKLHAQLSRQLERAVEAPGPTVVVYGERCFLDSSDPTRDTEALIREVAPSAVRLDAAHCVDMLAGEAQRQRLADGERVHWLTPGWIRYWDAIFADWDAAKANETFPQNEKALVLDGIGFFEAFGAAEPERVLEISDWMGLSMEAAPISLDRFHGLLVEAARRAAGGYERAG
ncbi:MAG: DUF1638 domain-containing protein [Phycisphaerae bacterium]